jgi:hypothetical protein
MPNGPNVRKVHQYFPLPDLPKFTQSGIFVLKINHLATPVWKRASTIFLRNKTNIPKMTKPIYLGSLWILFLIESGLLLYIHVSCEERNLVSVSVRKSTSASIIIQLISHKLEIKLPLGPQYNVDVDCLKTIPRRSVVWKKELFGNVF